MWHSLTVEEAARAVGARLPHGLGHDEALVRLKEHGHNRLREAPARGAARMLLDQLTDLMVLLLIGAAAIAAFIGDPADAGAIGAIVILNTALGFAQEYRAERSMEALKKLAAPKAKVRRGGATVIVDAAQLAPGDVVALEAGGMVPADLRLAEAAALRVDESSLTGESQPAEKSAVAQVAEEAALGDRVSMAYKGTIVVHGRGLGIVVATGMRTELGRIAGLLQGTQEQLTPLQKRLSAFGRRLSLVAAALCALIFAAGLARGEEAKLMFLTALSLAVAAIPEALPAVVTVALALGARRLSRVKALVRRLPAVETLGSVTYICSDKTGTLTENRMRASAYHVDGPTWELLRTAMAISNDAGRGHGDPTERALLEAAAEAGYEKRKLLEELPRQAEAPFTSERGIMTTIHRSGEKLLVFTKGAPEKVLELCGRPELRGAADSLAAQGMRVLAFGTRALESLPARLEDAERELDFIGMVGLMDPPRAEAKAAVEECRAASIHVVMITGDHPGTARAVARRLGIEGDVVTGPELAALPLEAFERRVEHIGVYARVSPEQKIKIVQALQERGEFVAMTGDGVNDAPALKRADIGVAMGRSGTDVAREAAHMVLLDDNFATIVRAVREGRRIYDNIRKFVRYVLTGNTGELGLLLLAPFAGLPVPLLPIHILWINLVTDGLPGLALAAEPAAEDVMRRPPSPPDESIFAGMWQSMVWQGLLIAALSLGVQAYAYRSWSPRWQTMTFTTMTVSQMFFVLGLGSLSNLRLVGAVALTLALQLGVVYLPFFNEVFKTQPLTARELLVCLAAAPLAYAAVELEEFLKRAGRGSAAL